MEEIIVRYMHFIGIIVLASALVSEHLLISGSMPRSSFRKVLVLDRICGIAVVVVLIAGFLLWTKVGKPAEFYSSNPIFHTKITLFIVIGILAIAPAVYFQRNKKGDSETVAIPKYVIHLQRTQILVLLLLPFLAVLVSRGVGL